ncbi:hypothetical protein DRQ12_00995 [candidate division KSB1 bacterium]|nr:MAG: hypothetical protein DRQ12_00995 [candidate division KSB1 bacterium]RKY86954.1 MAG: hypothetical protein DRQ11_07380 [candidate division KSB1 bacterium]HDI51867.1 hypothetical protein [Bacteroidota bacterium]
MFLFHKSKKQEKHSSYFELIEAFNQPGCAICQLSERSAVRYVETILYENVNDPATRKKLRRSYGFCPHHAHIALKQQDAFGIGIIYADLLKNALSLISNNQWQNPKTAAQHCPACKIAIKSTERFLDLMLRHFPETDFQQALQIAEPLCWKHFSQLVALSQDPSLRRQIIDWELKKLQILQTTLAEFLRKQDYRFRQEGFSQAEKNAWLRAMEFFVGKLKQP